MRLRILHLFYLTLFSPILSLVLGLRDRGLLVKRSAIILFSIAYGATLTLSEESDGTRHLAYAEDYYQNMSLAQFYEESIAILSLSPIHPAQDDIYLHALSYIVSSLIGLPGALFFFAGLIYGIFYSGAIIRLIQLFRLDKSRTWSVMAGLFLIIFAIGKSFETINSIRTWTGFWVLAYGVLTYLYTARRRHLIWVLATPLIHFAYGVMAIPALVVLIFKPRPIIFSVIFALSFFIRPDANYIRTSLALGDLGKNKVELYYDEENASLSWVQKEYGGTRFYNQYNRLRAQDYVVSILAFFFILSGFYRRRMKRDESILFSIGILTIAVSKYLQFMSDLSNRISIIGFLFLCASFFLILSRLDIQYRGNSILKALTILTLIGLSPFFLYKISDFLYFTSLYMIFLPLTAVILPEVNISVQEFIKSIL